MDFIASCLLPRYLGANAGSFTSSTKPNALGEDRWYVVLDLIQVESKMDVPSNPIYQDITSEKNI